MTTLFLLLSTTGLTLALLKAAMSRPVEQRVPVRVSSPHHPRRHR